MPYPTAAVIFWQRLGRIMNKDIQEILFSEDELAAMVSRVAGEINRDYAGKDILLVGLLKGSAVFITDLMRKIDIPCSLDFMLVSSYGRSTKSSGMVNVKKDLDEDIEGRHVLIVEDIIDSGNTLSAVLELLTSRDPASLKLVSLLSKPSRREKEIRIDYLGTEIEDLFVVGYGLDYAEKYRNLPYIGILKPEVYL